MPWPPVFYTLSRITRELLRLLTLLRLLMLLTLLNLLTNPYHERSQPPHAINLLNLLNLLYIYIYIYIYTHTHTHTLEHSTHTHTDTCCCTRIYDHTESLFRSLSHPLTPSSLPLPHSNRTCALSPSQAMMKAISIWYSIADERELVKQQTLQKEMKDMSKNQSACCTLS